MNPKSSKLISRPGWIDRLGRDGTGSLWWAVFEKLPSDNAYGPVWSPDCAHLLFRIYTGDHWRLGLIGTDGSGFQFVGEISPANQDFQSPAWATDGKSIYAQDLTNIYQLDLTGKVLAQWKISDALSNADLNSGDRIEPTEDGKSRRISPPKVYAWDPCWLNAQNTSSPAPSTDDISESINSR